MKRSNIKILKLICLCLVIHVLLFALIKVFILDDGIDIYRLEKTYLSTQSQEDLFLLSTALIRTPKYEMIIEYYPKIIFNMCDLDDFIKKSEIWEVDRKNMETDDIKNMYVFTYLSAVFEMHNKTYFDEEFERCFSQIKFVEKNNKVQTLKIIQAFFANSLGEYSSGYDYDKIAAFMPKLEQLWNKQKHDEHYNNCFYLFCGKWYAKIGDTDSYNKAYKNVTKPVVAVFEWSKDLPNNYIIGYNWEYKGVVLGIKGYGVQSLLLVTDNIVAVAHNQDFVILKSLINNDFCYYIININSNQVDRYVNEDNFYWRIKDLNLLDLSFVNVSKNGWNQPEDSSVIES